MFLAEPVAHPAQFFELPLDVLVFKLPAGLVVHSVDRNVVMRVRPVGMRLDHELVPWKIGLR